MRNEIATLEVVSVEASYKANTALLYNPTTVLPGVYPKELKTQRPHKK